MLAHILFFWWNPRGSLDFLVYPIPKACQRRVLGTWVPRCFGVAHSSSSLKAAQALGCSLTPGLWISLGPVNCVAQAASASGLSTLGFLLLCGACVWAVTLPILAGFWGVRVWIQVLASPRKSWFGFVVRMFGLGLCIRPFNPGWDVEVCVLVRPPRLYLAFPG